MTEDIVYFTVADHRVKNDERLEHDICVGLTQTRAECTTHILERSIAGKGGRDDRVDVFGLDAARLGLCCAFDDFVVAVMMQEEFTDNAEMRETSVRKLASSLNKHKQAETYLDIMQTRSQRPSGYQG